MKAFIISLCCVLSSVAFAGGNTATAEHFAARIAANTLPEGAVEVTVLDEHIAANKAEQDKLKAEMKKLRAAKKAIKAKSRIVKLQEQMEKAKAQLNAIDDVKGETTAAVQ